MSVEQNKRIVVGFLENLSNNNIAAALAAMADTATFWAPGNLPTSGTKTKEEFAEVIKTKAEGSFWLEPVSFALKGITAEGDRVAVEVEGYGKRVNGKIYHNHYHFLFEVRESKIQAVREYLDTLHLKEVVFD